MKRIIPAIFTFNLLFVFAVSGQTFSEYEVPFEQMFNSGGCVGVCDMNQDGYDDVVILDQSTDLFIQYQNSDGSFTQVSYGSLSGSNQWGFSFGDYNQDGHNDVFSGGAYDEAHYISISDVGVYSVANVDDDNFFMQGCSTGDMDNDGWLDVFACNDDAESKIWGNDGFGGLIPQNDWIDMVTVPSSDNSGNYGSVLCDVDGDNDLDLYIAKCRQGVTDPEDPRRINVLFINDGDGNFTEEADARGLAPHHQSWTVDFIDIDNDGDFDCLLTNHDTSLLLFENDGSGYFTDITEGSGLEEEIGFFLQAKFEDFDNDGFVDLFYSGDIEAFFHNNGDQTFTKFNNKLPNNDVLHSFAFGDLNRDGWVDVYASYGNGYVNPDNSHPDKLWLNDGGDNNWVTFQLQGNESNNNAIGAKVIIEGEWGVQIREVRSGESYGIVNSFNLHFGLGSATEITSAEVIFPSGEIMTLTNPEINTFHEVIEGCTDLPEASIISEGSTILCNDESVTLNLTTTATNVLWSDGTTGSSITVNESGDYYVEVWDDEECVSSSNHIYVDVYVPQNPIIEVVGGPELCEGDVVTLISTEGVAYSWSDGTSEMVNEISESGTYSVMVTDVCENDLSSDDVTLELTFYPVPETPVISDIEILSGQSATFVVSSENAFWYDSENAEISIASGASFTTPILSTTTTYWVEYGNGGEPELLNGGKDEWGSSGQYHDNSTYSLQFTANENVVIKEVTVYADGEGDRTIQVNDEFGGVVAEGVFFIPDGESLVQLNFQVPAGTGYSLTTVGNPQLWRDQSDENLPYPYLIGDLVSIDGTNIGSNNWDNYYYFFYDWVVESTPFICAGERVEASAIVTGIEEFDFLNSFAVYPTPTSETLYAEINSTMNKNIEMVIINGMGQVVFTTGLTSINPGQNRIEFDMSEYSSGLYYLNLIVDGRMVSNKVVVD